MVTSDNNDFTPFAACHPSEIIKSEIEARGMSRTEFAKRMNMQPSNVTRLLKGEDITVQTAQRLEEALGIPAREWLGLQALYVSDSKKIALRNEREREAAMRERMINERYNLKEIYKYYHIAKATCREKQEELVLKMGLDAEQIMHVTTDCGHFKRNEKYLTDERNVRTWILIAYAESTKVTLNVPFEPGMAREAAQQIATLAHTGNATEHEISNILATHGISYVVVPALKGSYIDAYCAWVNDHPAIATTHRCNDMSRLIYDILHELGHIELHLGEGYPTFFITAEDATHTTKKLENEANEFAQNMLIDKATWAKIMSADSKGLWGRSIVNTLRHQALLYHLDFNIVMWRYQLETQSYRIAGVKAQRIR